MNFKFPKRKNSLKKKNFSINLNFYWRIAVCATLIIILSSFVFGYRLFMQINKEPILATTDKGGQVPFVNTARIRKILNYFEEREKRSTEILNSPSPIVDPSM